MRRSAAAAGLAGLCLAAAAVQPARAHDVNAYVSPSGVEFLEEQLPTYLPDYLAPPAITMQVADPCPGDTAITFTQQNTDLYLWIDAFDLSLPADGTLRADVTLTTWALGEAYIDNPYLCFGEALCDDELYIEGVRAVIDFAAWVDADGRPRVQLAQVDLELTPEDIYFALSNCAIDDIVNLVIDVGKGWAMDMLLEKVEAMAQEQLAPKLEEMLAGFASYEGTLGSGDFAARLTSVDLQPSGIGVGADIDLTSAYPAAACVGSDPGDPASHQGSAPNLAGGVPSHVGMSVNLGLVDDALYHVWHEGFMCVTPETLGALGIDFDLNAVGGLLPGFPEGTTFSLSGNVTVPPRVEGSAGEDATLELILAGVVVELYANLPDGTVRTLRLDLDASATASVAIDPAINALALQIGEVSIDRLEVDDEFGLEEAGFDFAKVEQLLEERVLPGIIDQLGALPVTGPVFGGLAGYYVILREIRTTSAYLLVKADLFRAPADDGNAPDTTIDEQPTRIVRPGDAEIVVSGVDAEIPSELLRYELRVDGVVADATYVRKFEIGEAGRTATYQVAVAAVDLAGNRDNTPAETQVTVDGVLPQLQLLEHPVGVIDTAAPLVTWSASDDLTAPEAIAASAKIYTLRADRSSELVGEVDLGVGQTSATLALEPGHEYRVVLTVTDQAGNAASDAMLFQVSGDAPSLATGGCGCTAAPRRGAAAGSGVAAALLAAAALILRRRTIRR